MNAPSADDSMLERLKTRSAADRWQELSPSRKLLLDRERQRSLADPGTAPAGRVRSVSGESLPPEERSARADEAGRSDDTTRGPRRPINAALSSDTARFDNLQKGLSNSQEVPPAADLEPTSPAASPRSRLRDIRSELGPELDEPSSEDDLPQNSNPLEKLTRDGKSPLDAALPAEDTNEDPSASEDSGTAAPQPATPRSRLAPESVPLDELPPEVPTLTRPQTLPKARPVSQPNPPPKLGDPALDRPNVGEDASTEPRDLKKLSAIKPFYDYELDLDLINDKTRWSNIKADPFVPRSFVYTDYHWEPSNLWHYPLYFEDFTLERYGHSRHHLIQPLFSAGLFSAQFVGLPYQIAIDPVAKRRYALGYYRPGTFVCPQYYQVPLNAHAAAWEAAVLTGGVFLLK